MDEEGVIMALTKEQFYQMYIKDKAKKAEETDKQYRAYLSMTMNSYHTKKGGRYPSKVYGHL